ncbi:MAG: PBS lyase, partial [Thermodesulfatator sp.]
MGSGYEVIEPRCPFCNERLDRPRELEPMRRGDFEYGVCRCGAVYVHDVTGFNLGAAMVEALEFACDADLDLAWDLMPDEDYHDALIEGYDIKKHLIYPAGHDYEGHRVKGALSFIRLADDLRDTKEQGVRQKYHTASPPPLAGSRTSSAVKAARKKRFSKREVAKAVQKEDLELLTKMASKDRLVLRKMQRLLYNADPKKRWQAVVMLGAVAGAMAQADPAAVGDLLRRLLYAANDSAAAN